ncbi:hypothetical protein PTTG_03526 [Puccinia triticina 1-1 BBBD Race 1]|uniref:Uncharacterized protein n=1 Tax=Puccinia triticina (isolate 1-1 / race 1 (BBBD)) TaxID=630390 RepID=A0A0C4ERV6_PUCT1|nr:hypothetical protein PTTG_03526 [Puccinia triticina 1-1 BBBD Race 1]
MACSPATPTPPRSPEHRRSFPASKHPPVVLIHPAGQQIIIHCVHQAAEDQLTLIHPGSVARIEAEPAAALLFLDCSPTLLSPALSP